MSATPALRIMSSTRESELAGFAAMSARLPVFCLSLLAILSLAACASGFSTQSSGDVRVVDGPLWLPADQTEHYACRTGVLVCDSPIGRFSERWCRCSR